MILLYSVIAAVAITYMLLVVILAIMAIVITLIYYKYMKVSMFTKACEDYDESFQREIEDTQFTFPLTFPLPSSKFEYLLFRLCSTCSYNINRYSYKYSKDFNLFGTNQNIISRKI